MEEWPGIDQEGRTEMNTENHKTVATEEGKLSVEERLRRLFARAGRSVRKAVKQRQNEQAHSGQIRAA